MQDARGGRKRQSKMIKSFSTFFGRLARPTPPRRSEYNQASPKPPAIPEPSKAELPKRLTRSEQVLAPDDESADTEFASARPLWQIGQRRQDGFDRQMRLSDRNYRQSIKDVLHFPRRDGSFACGLVRCGNWFRQARRRPACLSAGVTWDEPGICNAPSSGVEAKVFLCALFSAGRIDAFVKIGIPSVALCSALVQLRVAFASESSLIRPCVADSTSQSWQDS